MKILRPALLPLGLLLLIAAIGSGLLRTERSATWLHAEAPPHAIAGQTLPIRVTLAMPTSKTHLGVDLHWATSRREPRGFLSTSPARPVDRREAIYTFELPVPPRDDLGYVSAILFESSSGRWEDRTRVAQTALIPIRTSGAPGSAERIPVYELESEVVASAASSPTLRLAIAVLWLLCAIVLGRRRPYAGAGWLAVACAAAAIWELSNAELSLARLARAAALEYRLYYERFWLQEAATIAILVAAAALLGSLFLRSPARRLRLLRAALWLYAAVSLAGLVSLHEADRLLALPVLSVPLAQVAKLGIAVASFAIALWLRPTPPATAPAAEAARSAPVSPRAE